MYKSGSPWLPGEDYTAPSPLHSSPPLHSAVHAFLPPACTSVPSSSDRWDINICGSVDLSPSFVRSRRLSLSRIYSPSVGYVDPTQVDRPQ